MSVNMKDTSKLGIFPIFLQEDLFQSSCPRAIFTDGIVVALLIGTSLCAKFK